MNRQPHTFTVPISGGLRNWVYVQTPRNMTPEEWAEFERILPLFRKGIVIEPPPPSSSGAGGKE